MSLASFLVSVAAGVIANYICKWLDGCGKSSKHKKRNPLGVAPPRGFFILVSIHETVCIISTFIICDSEKKSSRARKLYT